MSADRAAAGRDVRRVLLLAQVVVDPPDAGPKVKTLQVLHHLAERHDVYFCGFARTPAEHRRARALGRICRRVVTVQLTRSRLHDLVFLAESMLAGESFLLRRDDRAAMHAAVRRLLADEGIDIIHVDQLNMMQFVPPEWPGTVIFDDHNAVWLLISRLREHTRNPVRRWLLGREAHLIARAEGAACRRARMTLAVSESDRAALREAAGDQAMIEVSPITVRAEQYAPIAAARQPQPFRLLTIGTMFVPANSEGVAWWLREGYGGLRMLCPRVTYDIIGPRPPAALRRLARRHPGVHVLGYVADPTPWWTNAAVLVVPLLSGGGVRVKILEAMAMGLPVVSTSIGCEGLAVRDGEHLLVADTPATFASACAAVLTDAALAQHLARNGRQLVLDRYDSRHALASLDVAYARALYREQPRAVLRPVGIEAHQSAP